MPDGPSFARCSVRTNNSEELPMQATHQVTHKVPTHMSLPDKVVFGFTARQLLVLVRYRQRPRVYLWRSLRVQREQQRHYKGTRDRTPMDSEVVWSYV